MIYFFISLVFANLFLCYKSYIYLLLLLVSLYYLGKKVNVKLCVINCISIVVFCSFNFNYYVCNEQDGAFTGTVEVVEQYENYSIVGQDDNKYLIYNNENNFKEGNEIYFEGNLVSITNTYNEFYKYLNKSRVYYELDYRTFEVVDNNINFNVFVVDKLLESKSEETKSYLKLILFNVKDGYNREFYNTFSIYSLTYLIAVSGFHINLLLSFFKKIFKNNLIGIGFVCFYLYLLNFSVSSYRALMCYLFKSLNKKLDFKISNLEIVGLVGSVFIIVNPSVMFSLGFIFSFLASLVLEIFKVYKCKSIVTMFYIYLINLPILLLNYYKLNISSLFFSLLLTYPVSFLYIFSFLFLFLDKFYLLYELVISLFYKLLDLLNKFNFIVVFGKPTIVFVIVYYLLLVSFFVLKERKSVSRYIYMFFLVVMLFYQYNKPYLNFNEKVYFLNVGQGDCSVFFIPNSKEVVLVDTGGSKYKDIAVSEIIPFLESKGINRIRTVIVTHDDYDHNGALDSLRKNFKVENVINSSLIKEVSIGNKVFENLNVSEHRDNEGSLVLYGEYAGYYFLLMGDASIDVENKISQNIGRVDVVKIGHHGSNTSSGYEFLDYINGKFAIISVGTNRYGHPHKEVVERLIELGYVIFRTDKNNDIGFEKRRFNLAFIDYFN